MNKDLVHQIVRKMIICGVQDVCLCPGGQNAEFISALKSEPNINIYYWFEERSAAFFALGKCRTTGRPTAVITTSGTACAELLPATIEAFYTKTPLLLVTADRPSRFRGTGAPQSIEQKGIFTSYVNWSQDIENDELCELDQWSQDHPGHLNVCLEEPEKQNVMKLTSQKSEEGRNLQVIVGGINPEDKEMIIQSLIELQAPVYPESLSGLREDTRLQHLITPYVNHLWNHSSSCGYPITDLLRIGTVPTVRFWRDLESHKKEIKVTTYSHLPFSGLSRESDSITDLQEWVRHTLNWYNPSTAKDWIAMSWECWDVLETVRAEYPQSEPSMFYALSKVIPDNALVYLGNSMPIREWDLMAERKDRQRIIGASRGANGIDGQLSTFFGMCERGRQNWAILGDLTTLYDLAAPWILSYLREMDVTIVVINNYGGKIFKRMFSEIELQNCHQLQFEKFAELWNIPYYQWREVPAENNSRGIRLIELLPDLLQTEKFWDALDENLCSSRLPRKTIRLELSTF